MSHKTIGVLRDVWVSNIMFRNELSEKKNFGPQNCLDKRGPVMCWGDPMGHYRCNSGQGYPMSSKLNRIRESSRSKYVVGLLLYHYQ